jgi:hypothetical protein
VSNYQKGKGGKTFSDGSPEAPVGKDIAAEVENDKWETR